mgnify:FL=1|tara:strand:+ start:41 stop:763 length:723 start_codon:yes stop_codon:yes gene_type:complete
MVMPPNNKTEAMMGFQDEVNKDPMNALNMIQGGLSSVPPNVEQGGNQGMPPNVEQGGNQGMPPLPPQQTQDMSANIPVFIPDVKKNVNELLTISKDNKLSLAERAIKALSEKANLDLFELSELEVNDPQMFERKSGGGLMQLAAGGEFSGMVPGDGHGMEDNVYMPIKEGNEQVATLAVSPSEYVVDSYTMAALGNGNAEEGADVMDETVKKIRKKAYGSEEQPNEIDGLAALRPLIERV